MLFCFIIKELSATAGGSVGSQLTDFIGYSENGYLMPYFLNIFFKGFMIDLAQRV